MNCYKKILSTYDSLPKQQKKIADYIVLNINEVVFFSITTLASELGVSEATIVRFAQNLGYKGFPELKKDLVHYYQNYLTPGERLKNSIEILAGGDFSFEKAMRHELKCLEETIDSVNASMFTEIVDSICKKNRVFVFGLGLSNEPVVNYLSFRLRRFGLDVRDIPYSGSNMMECIPAIKKNDLVIIYQFLKASPDYYSLTIALQSTGAALFLITDNKKLDLVKAVDKVITVNRGPVENYHTLTVPFAVTSAIILGVAEKMGEKAIDFTSKVGQLRRGYYRSMNEAYLPYRAGEKMKKEAEER
ncbi:MAG: MurR/RpiR family transcriptional regulator [Spirochaetia bacterium]|jgi:DNA-binding MurR/RpiR family transcriptional regulator|nr:MurR/RpiR family transcriptional regulator [Spirochaetia bacterium]